MNKVYVIAYTKGVKAGEYSQYINKMKTRRYGKLLKRALATAVKCMQESGIPQPDAILNGTALGSWEDSEKILDGLVHEGEEINMPTHFMLCTHNAVASVIAVYTRNHGYNNTYSQGRVSFESALLDAFLQIRSGRIHSALVCSNDEITPGLKEKMTSAGLSDDFVKDHSLAVMLSDTPGRHPLEELESVEIRHHTDGDHATLKVRKLCG